MQNITKIFEPTEKLSRIVYHNQKGFGFIFSFNFWSVSLYINKTKYFRLRRNDYYNWMAADWLWLLEIYVKLA